ncbi:BREX-2 system adenine-specific DNA-methyltransferase PglX [Plantactinospora sp. WMMC1484]|uniref:BREX-2 system adenine-specific DNA-methyltransferase PglX n=1 Tax=Plantactinospora sp. WMMC1484 TaxID=3404122 RepID=UPI003BF50CC9
MIELKALQGQVRSLVDDLREQVADAPALRSELRQEYAQAKTAERVAASFETWLEDILDQAAVAWVLGCVFVRFCEDNELVDGLWIGGPEPAAPAERAMQHRQAHLIANPRHNDREWLREAFGYLRGLRATGKIFDKHNPVWRFPISGPAAEELSDFFRRGAGLASLREPELNTRFLGDLYQDLSAHAKKTYALLQTPEFVEEFILDRTFEPAVKEFGLPATSVIDPTCGSGHFLLGAFHRLVRKWQEREPATDIGVLVERALGQVTGVDINPFAVAIARFRLLIAAMKLRGVASLERTPAWPIRVATGDSLLPWGNPGAGEQTDVFKWQTEKPFAYSSEDEDVLPGFLRPGQYTVVVGNPPYITVPDSARGQLYRELYPTVCYRQYAMTVPFAKRFFDLAVQSDDNGEGGGWVGQITGNSFMKREFGKRLISDYFAHDIELTEVIDTSAAYIPGHTTPTVILIGKAKRRRRSARVRTVVSIGGEAVQPKDPARGKVWLSIVNQVDLPGSESRWISVLDLPREQFSAFPWSLSGAAAIELMRRLIRPHRLAGVVQSIGRTTVLGEDDVWILPDLATARRLGELESVEVFVTGENVRDFRIEGAALARSPYRDPAHLDVVDHSHTLPAHLWPYRVTLQARVIFGQTLMARGRAWYEHLENYTQRLRLPLSIVFVFVATHNHFVLDRGGKIFNRHAPVIKLSDAATEDDYIRLLGILNSSVACFWLKQVSFDKGSQSGTGGFMHDEWERFYEFSGTKLQDFPLPEAYPSRMARELDGLAQRLGAVTPAAVAASGLPSRRRLAEAKAEYYSIRARMIARQEELDWEVYRLYGLIDEDLTHPNPPELNLGERAFEIVMAASKVQTEWFNRHGSTPTEKPHDHWPADYRALVERRIAVIRSDRHIGLIERPECKRRWKSKSWNDMQKAALQGWLLNRLEAPELWGGLPEPLSVAQLADRVRHDEDFRAVLDLWMERDDYNLMKALGSLVADEHVPYLPVQRYRPAGLRKRAEWERTWALQRLEDAGEKVEIDPPPKYTSADFARSSYWDARGKSDVPKERFISYPKVGRDGDDSELLGWAGWDHLAQAQALAMVYLDRKTQAAWPAHRLLPLLAGLVELEPWLRQWHAAEAPGFPNSPAEFFTDFINGELAQLSSDRSALALLRGVPELS